jgi:hypothetical protein
VQEVARKLKIEGLDDLMNEGYVDGDGEVDYVDFLAINGL